MCQMVTVSVPDLRYKSACGDICGCRTELVPAFVRLLQDNEAEVRVAAASKVSTFCKIFNNEAVISALLPCIKELSTDSSQCAACSTSHCVLLGLRNAAPPLQETCSQLLNCGDVHGPMGIS